VHIAIALVTGVADKTSGRVGADPSDHASTGKDRNEQSPAPAPSAS
jgi:hypothetical protein